MSNHHQLIKLQTHNENHVISIFQMAVHSSVAMTLNTGVIKNSIIEVILVGKDTSSNRKRSYTFG